MGIASPSKLPAGKLYPSYRLIPRLDSLDIRLGYRRTCIIHFPAKAGGMFLAGHVVRLNVCVSRETLLVPP
jgi:hypothetical protein